MSLVPRLYLSIAVAAATLWPCAGYTQDRLKTAIIFDSEWYASAEWLCGTNMHSFKNAADKQAYCATLPSSDERRDFQMEVRTIFATSRACAGIPVVVYDDGKKVNSPEMMKAKLADHSWWLRLAHLAEVPAGRALWELQGDNNAYFDGIGTPSEVVAKVCAIVQSKGGTVSGN